MKFLIQISYCLLFCGISFSQNKANYPIKYQIETIPNPQMLELIKFNDSSYSGSIVTTLWVGEDMESQDFTQQLSDDLAESVFENLTANGINRLEPCNNCNGIFYMDGSNINFKFYENDKFIKRIGFEEIHSSQNHRVEENPIRRKAQILIDIIEEHIGMEKYFSKLLWELPKGSYSWYIGNRMINYKFPN